MTISHNRYFDDQVQSLAFTHDGATASVGVMAPGEYHFGTAAPERMTVVSGELVVQLPGDETWHTFGAGDVFEVPGDSGFDLRVGRPTAYLCEYL